MGTHSVNWPTILAGENWLYSPQLKAWQKAIVRRLQSRVPRKKDVLWILSSGTTSQGQVKAVGLSFAAIECAAEGANQHLGSDVNDRWLVAIPRYHIGGLAIFVRAALSRARVNEFKERWQARSFCQVLRAQNITLTSLVPTQVYDLVANQEPAPPELRAVVVGGAALSRDLYFAARNLGWPLLPSYGLTECASQVATASLPSLSSNDYPALNVLPHVQVELREQRIFLKSPALCRWIATGDVTGQTTLEEPRRVGWLATEDLGDMHGGGLNILGRRDDVVKVLGVMVNVPEVEEQLLQFFLHAGLEGQLSVLASPQSRLGHQLTLYTDTTQSLRLWQEQLDLFNLGQIGPSRVASLCWVPQIPRNEMGKVQRALLRAI